MAVLKIIRLGHPKLRKKSVKVSEKEIQSEAFQTFLDELADTCLQNKGAGIAAPQVGVNKRIIVVYVDPKNPRYPDRKPFPLTIVINPMIVNSSEVMKEDWEGDLSVDLRALVPRRLSCTVVGLDRTGKTITFNLVDDFHARVFQHEIDHLDGVMFLDKVIHKETISEIAEWKKYWKKKDVTHEAQNDT